MISRGILPIHICILSSIPPHSGILEKEVYKFEILIQLSILCKLEAQDGQLVESNR